MLLWLSVINLILNLTNNNFHIFCCSFNSLLKHRCDDRVGWKQIQVMFIFVFVFIAPCRHIDVLIIHLILILILILMMLVCLSCTMIPLTILNVVLTMFYFLTFVNFFGHTDEIYVNYRLIPFSGSYYNCNSNLYVYPYSDSQSELFCFFHTCSESKFRFFLNHTQNTDFECDSD